MPCNITSDCPSDPDYYTGYCNSIGYCDYIPGDDACSVDDCDVCDPTGNSCVCASPQGGWPLKPVPASGTSWTPTQLGFGGGLTVTGIWFSSTTHGVITVSSEGAGAVLSMIGPLQTTPSPAFDGTEPVVTGGQSVGFYGLTASSAGLAALSSSYIAVISINDGGSFQATQSGIAQTLEESDSLIWLGKDTSGRWMAADSTQTVYTSTATNLSISAPWTPYTIDNDSFDLPANLFYVTPDGTTAVYIDPESPIDESYPQGYVLNAWGGNPTPNGFMLPGISQSASAPQVLAFADSEHGMIAAGADPQYEGSGSYLYLTTNGGGMWVSEPFLPTDLIGFNPEFNTAFYSLDGTTLWLGGYATTDDTKAVLISSALGGQPYPDGGSSFQDLSAKVQQLIVSEGGVFTGFALDSQSIWLGAEDGALLYSNTGGQ